MKKGQRLHAEYVSLGLESAYLAASPLAGVSPLPLLGPLLLLPSTGT